MSSSAGKQRISIRSSEPFASDPPVVLADIPAGYDNGTVLPAAYKTTNQPYYLTSDPANLNVTDTLAVGGEINLNGGALTVAGGELLLDGVPVGGGGGGAVDSVTAGAGLVVAPTTGAVVVSMPAVGAAGTTTNVANIQTDAQGRVVAVTSLGYVAQSAADVAAAVAPKADLAGAVFTGPVNTTATTLTVATPVLPAQAASKSYVDSAISGGSVVVGAGTNIAVGGTPTNPIVSVNVDSTLNMNSQTITNSGNISAPTGAQLDITAGELNLVQTGSALAAPAPYDFGIGPTVMNLTASGAIGIAAVGGVGIGGAGGVFIDTGGIVQIASGGSVSIGSANILGATTEIEHVSFKDNEISNANAGEELVISGVDTINMIGDLTTTADVNTRDLFASGDVVATGFVQSDRHVVGTGGAFTDLERAADGTLTTQLNGAGSIGGLVDTLLNPAQLALAGTTLSVKAKDGAGAVQTMSSVDLAPIIPAVPAGISSYLTVNAAPGSTYAVTAAQANTAIFIDVTAEGNVNVTLPNGVPNGTMFFIGLPYDTAGGSQLTVFPVGGGIGAGRETVIKAANGGCLYIANGTVAGNVMYMPTDTGAYLALTGGELTGALTMVGDSTVAVNAAHINTENIAALAPASAININSLAQTRELYVRPEVGGSQSILTLAESITAPPAELATIKYGYALNDTVEINKRIAAPAMTLASTDVLPTLLFKDAATFYVSKNGSDSNSGSILEPFLTVQAAVTAALATGSEAVVDIAPGTYEENITIASQSGICLRGALQSDRMIEGTTLQGTIAIQCNTTDNLNNNQVVISGCCVLGHIHDTSTKAHTLIVDGCRIEGDNSNGGKAIEVQITATDGRTFVNSCVITQEAGTTGTNPLISVNAGWLDINDVRATVRAEGCAVTMSGTSLLTRMANCALESGSASASPNALLFLNSTAATAHNIALTSFAYSVATAKTTPAILATRPSPGSILAVVANCLFAIAGTAASGSVIQYGAGTALVLFVAANRSLNSSAAAYASQIQSGATVLPLSMVGESSVQTVNGLSGALTLAAGSGLSLGTVGNTLTLTNTRTGVVESVTSGGAGISVTGTTANPVVNNTGVTRLIAGTNVTLSAETGEITISASGGGGGGGNVDTVSAGTGITLTGTAQDVIVNNAGVLSVTAQGGITNVGTAADPILELSGTGTVTFQDVNATNIAADDITVTNFPTVPGASLPTQPRQLVPKAYVDGQSYGVQSVTAADASINVGGTPSAVTLSVAASGVAGGSYTNASISVGADGRLTAASSGPAPVLSVSGTAGEITSTGGQNPTLALATAGTAGAYTFPSAITTDVHGRVTAVTSGSQPITTVAAGQGISVATLAGTATVTNNGVRSLTAADSSVTVAGTANAPTVALPAQTITPNAYTWPAITVNDKGIVTAVSENTEPYTSISAGSGISISGSKSSATVANTGMLSLNSQTGNVSLAAGANVTIDDTIPGTITISASGGGGGGGTVTSVSGVPTQITVANGTTTPLVGLATFGAGEATYNIAGGSIAVDDYGRVMSAVGVDQTTINGVGSAITLAGAGGVSVNRVGQTITITGSGGGGGTVTSVSGTGGVAVDNTDPANPIVSLETLGGLTPGDYVAPNISVNSKGQITFASSGTYGIVNSVVGGTNISVDSLTDPYNPVVSLNGISGNATAPINMQTNELTSDTYMLAQSMYATTGYIGHWDGPGSTGNKWAIPYQDADGPGEDSLRVVKLDATLTEVPNTSAVLYSERYNPLITTPFATSPSTVAPIGTTINNAGVDIVSGSITLNSANWPTLKTGYYGILGNISLVTNTAQPLRFTIRGQITGKASTTFVAQYVSEGQYHTVPLNNISFGFGTNGQIAQGDTLTITVRCATITSLATTTIATAVPVLPVVLSPLTMAV